VTDDHNRHMPDLSLREWAVIGPLCAAAVYMGVLPNVFLKPMEPAITRIVQRMESREPLQVRLNPPRALGAISSNAQGPGDGLPGADRRHDGIPSNAEGRRGLAIAAVGQEPGPARGAR
jgi:hypothetical protein